MTKINRKAAEFERELANSQTPKEKKPKLIQPTMEEKERTCKRCGGVTYLEIEYCADCAMFLRESQGG